MFEWLSNHRNSKVAICGAGGTGIMAYEYVTSYDYYFNVEVSCFLDNNKKKYSTKLINLGISDYTPSAIKGIDIFIIAIVDTAAIEAVNQQLVNLNVNPSNIVVYRHIETRILMLSDYLHFTKHNDYILIADTAELRSYDNILDFYLRSSAGTDTCIKKIDVAHFLNSDISIYGDKIVFLIDHNVRDKVVPKLIDENHESLDNLFFITQEDKQFAELIHSDGDSPENLGYAQSKSKSTFIIASMHKTGSSSIYNTLKHVFPNISMFHLHHLTMKENQYGHSTHRYQIILNYYRALISASHLKSNRNDVNIITLVRDPVARSISLFFNVLSNYYAAENVTIEHDVDDLIKYYVNSNFVKREAEKDFFKDELEEYTGINIYKHNYPQERGYAIIRKNGFNVLLYKLELIKNIFNISMRHFLNTSESFTLQSTNIGQRKQYSQLYKRFKSKIIIPEHIIRMYYDNPWVKHFYTSEEILQMKTQWSVGNNYYTQGMHDDTVSIENDISFDDYYEITVNMQFKS